MFRRFIESLTEPKIAAILVVLTLAVFGPAVIHNGFVSLDDNYLIYENEAVKTLTPATIAHVFSTYDPQLYIPLTFVSYQLNAVIFGMSPVSFHVINLLLHCANVVLVLLIIRRLSGKLLVATVAALLFAIHPLQTEAVMWAASRKDLLSGFFFLTSSFEYLRYRETWNRKHLIGSILLFGLALLSKVSVILLPVWLLMIDWLQSREKEKEIVTEKIPYGVLVVIFGVIAVIGKSTVLSASGTLVNFLLPIRSAVFYLEKMLWPSGLSVIYPYFPGNQFIQFGISVIVFVAILGLFGYLVAKNKHRLVAFCILTYFILLAPSFSTFWKNGFLYFASDRYAYLASIGAFTLAGLAVDYCRRKRPASWIAVPSIVLGAYLLVLLFLTYTQSKVWANSIALYRNAMENYPSSVMAHTNLGLELQRAGDLPLAQQHYESAMYLDPHSTHAYFNLASLYLAAGKQDKREEVFVQIIDAFTEKQVLSPVDAEPFIWLGTQLDNLGKGSDALRLLEKLVQLAPSFPNPHLALGEKYRSLARDADALKEFEAAAEAGSKNKNTYYYLAEYYSNANRLEDTIAALEKGIELDPTNLVAKQQLLELKR